MSDLCQSSLCEPTTPRENLLQRATKKKQAKVVREENLNGEKQVSGSTTASSRPSHSFVPFLEYFTQRRKINNNNNCNKFSHERRSKASEARDGDTHASAQRCGGKFSFFRSKRSSHSSARESASKKETSQFQDRITDVKESERSSPQAKDEKEVLCHGLLTKTDSLGHTCLLSHPGSETNSSSESGAHRNSKNEVSDLFKTVGSSGGEMQSNKNEVGSKNEKFVDSSGLQEQMNSINLKRCKDAVMPHSINSPVTLPAHSESLSIPPVIEETEEGNADEPHVIEVFLPHRELPAKDPPTVVFVPSSCDIPETHGSTKKRNKLRHILRRLLTMNGSFMKEDKQWLVDEEEDDEEEQVMTETDIDGEEAEADQKCGAAKTPSTQDNTEAVTPEKKRGPGTKVMSC